MLARSGLVGKNRSRPHLGPFEAIFSMGRIFPIFLGGPMGPIHPVWGNGCNISSAICICRHSLGLDTFMLTQNPSMRELSWYLCFIQTDQIVIIGWSWTSLIKYTLDITIIPPHVKTRPTTEIHHPLCKCDPFWQEDMSKNMGPNSWKYVAPIYPLVEDVRNICPSSAKRICNFSVRHWVISQGSTHNNRGARARGG